MLGEVTVVDDHGGCHSVPGEVQRRLVALLSVELGRPVSTARLVDELWGDEPPADPANALQSRVSRLRRVFRSAGGEGALVHRDGGYLLVDDVSVDAHRFEDAVRAGDHELALAMWRGEPFGDAVVGSALELERLRLTELRASVVERALALRLDAERPAAVIGELEALVADQPLRERTWALLMTAYSAAGRRADALDAYQRVRRVLAVELGIDPGAELQELERRVLDGAADPTADDPTSPPGGDRDPAPRPRLRRPSSALLGREAELAALRDAAATSRLVTITGPGGVGKTRLLTELATTTDRECVLVELVALGDGDVVGRVALDLGVRQGDRVDDPLLDRLVFALDGRELLLAIDNAEHLLAETRALVAELLRRTDARFVVTSREPLGIHDEQHLPLGPFSTPQESDPAHPAIELFVLRSRQRRPGWVPDHEELDTIAELCRRLDGVPLAIELAAARSAALSPGELLDRLDPIRLTGRTGGPDHHRSVSTMIDWSYDRLDGDERLVLDRLSVFSGAASLAAIEVVAGGGPIEPEDVAELVARLVDRSLVVTVDDDGQRRFDLLSLVRAQVRRRADRADLDAAATRLVGWAVGVAADADAALRTARARRAWATLRVEHEQLMHALDEAERLGLRHQLARLTRALCWWWFISGRHEIGLRWLDVVAGLDDIDDVDRSVAMGIGSLMGLRLPGHASEAADRRALTTVAREGVEGRFRYWEMLMRLTEAFAQVTAGHQTEASEIAELVRGEARDLGEPWVEATAGLVLGTAHYWGGRLPDALGEIEQALAVADRCGDPWVQGLLLGNRSAVRESLGDLAGARLDIETCLDLLGDEPEVLSPEGPIRLADLTILEGDPAAGFELATRAIDHVRRLGAVGWLAGAHCSRAHAARRLGRLGEAADDYRLALDLYESQGFHVGRIMALSGLGFCAEEAGDLEAARDLHTDELQLARAFGDPRAVAQALEGLAAVAVGEGDALLALRHLGEADGLRRAAGGPLPEAERLDVERVEAVCRRLLGDDVVELTLGPVS